MSDEVLPLAQANGVGIIVRSVYLKGALSPRAEYLPARLNVLKKRASAVRRLAAAIKPKITLVEAALKFVLSQPFIATALVGVRDTSELDASLAVLRQSPWSEDIVNKFKQLRCDDPYLLDPSQWDLP